MDYIGESTPPPPPGVREMDLYMSAGSPRPPAVRLASRSGQIQVHALPHTGLFSPRIFGPQTLTPSIC
jgi:hypothetical protein